MDKVFVVVWQVYSDAEIHGVFTSEERAKAYIAKIALERSPFVAKAMRIEEFQLNGA